MLVLNHDDVRAALPMSDCIEAMRDALIDAAGGCYQQFPRFQLRPAAVGTLMGLMPVLRTKGEAVWCLKDVIVAPGNAALGLDSHQGAVLVHDGATGVLRAMLDATAITAIRTAATSAVATTALARPDTRKVAILGAGTQARAHLEALQLVLPDREFVVWSRSPAKAASLAAEFGASSCESIDAALDDADVVNTVTASRTPLFALGRLKAGCHVNAVGTSSADARELDSATVEAAQLFVDSRLQAMQECGELLIPIAEGRIAEDHVQAELGQVLAGLHPGRDSPAALTIFKSLGIAVEDLAAALRAISNARARGIGHHVAW